MSAVFALDLNGFRLTCPGRFMGALHVHPRVEIHTDLLFARSTSP